MFEIIDGIKIANKITIQNRKKVEQKKLKLKLSVILLGDNKTSLSYISQKEKVAFESGVDFSLFKFSKKIDQEDFAKKIVEISRESSGTIIQLPTPFPRELEQEMLNLVPQEKDIDILSEVRLGRYYAGDFSVLPPVVGAVRYILKEKEISLKGKKVAVVGSGKLVGKPLTIWLMANKATVTILNEFSRDKKELSRSDIVISGVGKEGLIKSSDVKKGVFAIDAGSVSKDNSIKGDFDKSVYKKASFYTPVPGGVGPITSACLIENLIKLNET